MVEGFKNTELGMIPTDWDVESIGTKIDLLTGYPFQSINYSNAGIRLLRGSNIKRGVTDWNLEITKYWENVPSQLRPYLLKEGDIVISMDGSLVGRSFARLSKRDLPALLLQRVARVRSSEIDMGYLKEFICSYYFTRHCEIIKTASAIPHISPKDIRTFKIPLPPSKAEQTAIAKALNDANALIYQLEQLLSKKRNIKTGTLQELLKPKDGWIEKKLGPCLKQNPEYGIGAVAVTFNEALPVYLRITDITEDGKYSKKNIVSVDNPRSKNYFLEKGDLVFARTGASVGKTYLYNPKDEQLVFAGFLIRVKVNPEILIPEYFQFYTQTFSYWNWIRSNSMRTGQPGINGKEYKELPVSIPKTTDEQISIVNILTDMDNEIEELNRKLEKYKMIKQGMMQLLLTGKIRLV